MNSSPFDLTDIGVRPTTPIPPDLVRVFFADVTADKVYYVKYITHPGTFEWLLVKVTSKGDRITFGPVWNLASMGYWRPLGTTMNATPAQIDTDIPDGSLASRYHFFYAPESNSTRNLAPKPAPRDLHQRKARRISSRKSRHNNKKSSKRRRNNKNSSKSRR